MQTFLLQLLGLLLPKYVPDEILLRQPSWLGVVQHADALVPMLQQHVIEPLLNGEHGSGQKMGVPGVAQSATLHLNAAKNGQPAWEGVWTVLLS